MSLMMTDNRYLFTTEIPRWSTVEQDLLNAYWKSKIFPKKESRIVKKYLLEFNIYAKQPPGIPGGRKS